MSNRNDHEFAMLLALLGGGGILFFVWWFSTAVGLDMNTAGKVIAFHAIPIALGAVSLTFFDDHYDLLRFGNAWPVLLGLVWMAWWPALDYWAAHVGYRPSLYDEEVTVWWNAWYTKFGVLAALIGGGYFAKTRF